MSSLSISSSDSKLHLKPYTYLKRPPPRFEGWNMQNTFNISRRKHYKCSKGPRLCIGSCTGATFFLLFVLPCWSFHFISLVLNVLTVSRYTIYTHLVVLNMFKNALAICIHKCIFTDAWCAKVLNVTEVITWHKCKDSANNHVL